MRFTKAEVNGNDFVILENVNCSDVDIKRIADRRYGIGSDQVIFFDNSSNNVQFFNMDGQKADMCGNGLCALAKIYPGRPFKVGKTVYETSYNNNGFCSVILPMPVCLKSGINYKFIDTGNKHIVHIGKNMDMLSYNDQYNVHFLKILSKNKLSIETYERGVGKTYSCGSGAIASAFAYGEPGAVNHVIHEGGESYVDLSQSLSVVAFAACPNILFYGDFY
ncbi:MAG: hypothetical protein LBI26_00825 [Holosporales bacterium]|nr:hypothetical protein [Holosporales bacterium]